MRILIAEDEKMLARAIMKILEKNNYSADMVYNGKDALSYAELGNYDAIILDIMMPQLDGLSVLKNLRANGNSTPVLILSAKSQVEDKVRGLDSGANYYLTKPFEASELLATIRAITRVSSTGDNKLYYGNVTLDRSTFELSTPEKVLKLANKEFQIMELFMTSPRRMFSTERLLEKIWGYDNETEINVVWVYISYLRKKLTGIGANICIRASRNAGYSLEEKNDKEAED